MRPSGPVNDEIVVPAGDCLGHGERLRAGRGVGVLGATGKSGSRVAERLSAHQIAVFDALGWPPRGTRKTPSRSVFKRFLSRTDGGDCTSPAACLQSVYRMCGFLSAPAMPTRTPERHANRPTARLRPVGRSRLRQRRTGCPEHCRRPASTTCARRKVRGLEHVSVPDDHCRLRCQTEL